MKTIDKNMDLMKAIKKADREIELENSVGFNSVTRIHKSKKLYNRKESKRVLIFD